MGKMNNNPAAVERFTFPTTGDDVRRIIVNGTRYLVLTDACKILQLTNITQVVAGLDDDEYLKIEPWQFSQLGLGALNFTDNLGRPRTLILVNEPGFYSVVLRSKKPEAKAFQRWVRHEVLPSIHETGQYALAGQPQLPQTYAAALRELADEVDRREKVEHELELSEQRVEARQPFVDAFKTMVDAEGTFLVRDAAKAITDNLTGQVIGERDLFAFLQDRSWIYRPRGSGRRPWAAYQAAIRVGHLVHKLHTYTKPDGEPGVEPQVRVTLKGLIQLHKLLGGSGDLVNLPPPSA